MSVRFPGHKARLRCGYMVFGLVSGLSAALAVLLWVGWRFFAQASPTIAPPSRPAQHEATVKVWPFFRHSVSMLARWPVWAPLIAVAASSFGVLKLAPRVALDPLSAGEMLGAAHIRTALTPEKLVPPPPLPATLFVGTERAGLEGADRNWSRLDPQFMQLALQVFARVEARGYPLVLLEGYRSPERQNMLAAMGPQVTQARAFQSRHQFGQALDAAPMANGRLLISERDPWAMQAYQALGEEAEKLGLVWGGRWSFRDYGHIELPKQTTPAASAAAAPSRG